MLKNVGVIACVAVTVASLLFAVSRGSEAQSGSAAGAGTVGRYQIVHVTATRADLRKGATERLAEVKEVFLLDTVTGYTQRYNYLMMDGQNETTEPRIVEGWVPFWNERKPRN